MVIELVLAALALAAAGSAVVAVRKKREQQRGEERPPALPPAPRQLTEGQLLPRDVITHLGTDYLVEGVATFSEGGRSVLVAASLNDGDQSRWLLVDLGPTPHCALVEEREVGALGQSVPSWVPDGPIELELTRRASVRVRALGRCLALPPDGPCEYGLYRGPGQREGAMFLSDAGEILLIGRQVTVAGLVLLPGGSVEEERSLRTSPP